MRVHPAPRSSRQSVVRSAGRAADPDAAAPTVSCPPPHAESPIYLPGSVELQECTLSPSAAHAAAAEDASAAAALPSPSAVAAGAAELGEPSAAAAAAGLISDGPSSGRTTAVLHTIVVQQQQHMQQQQEQQQQQQFDSSAVAVAAAEGTRPLQVKRVNTNKKYLVEEAEEVNQSAHMQTADAMRCAATSSCTALQLLSTLSVARRVLSFPPQSSAPAAVSFGVSPSSFTSTSAARPPWMIHPHSPALVWFSMILMGISLYNVFTVPYRWTFWPEQSPHITIQCSNANARAYSLQTAGRVAAGRVSTKWQAAAGGRHCCLLTTAVFCCAPFASACVCVVVQR